MLEKLTLTPPIATALFVLAVYAGHRYRHNWKTEGPTWKAWLFGILAGGSLLILGFVPLTTSLS
ncbi:MAG: hypothetical protein AAGG72_10820 [Pseudomonadota bacterium]